MICEPVYSISHQASGIPRWETAQPSRTEVSTSVDPRGMQIAVVKCEQARGVGDSQRN
jgi:hypothetical protein